jgi:hypothetical protein
MDEAVVEQGLGEARLADAWLARDQDDATFAGLGLFPAPRQWRRLLVDERGQCRSAQNLEPARDTAWTQYLPGLAPEQQCP